jgi:hypothetical protein
MTDKLKTSFELAMERLRADDPAAGKVKPLTSEKKEEIAEARRVAAARLAELEILFNDPLKRPRDPADRQKAEAEYQIDRQRINADLERAIEAIRREGNKPGPKSSRRD